MQMDFQISDKLFGGGQKSPPLRKVSDLSQRFEALRQLSIKEQSKLSMASRELSKKKFYIAT